MDFISFLKFTYECQKEKEHATHLRDALHVRTKVMTFYVSVGVVAARISSGKEMS